MVEPELRLDPAIRLWVFLPIVVITFLVGIIKHYVSILLTSPKKVDLAQVKDSQIFEGTGVKRKCKVHSKTFFFNEASLFE